MAELTPGSRVGVTNPNVSIRTSMPGKVDNIWLKEGPTGPPGTPGAPGGVTSINGEVGVVTLIASEVPFTPAGGIAATNVQAAIAEVDAEKQPLDADLTTIAGLTATTDNIIQSVAGAWASRTPAQARLALEAAGSTGGGREKSAALSATTGTCTGDLSTASVFTIAPSGNWTLAFSNVPATGTACTVTVIVSETATIRTMTQPTGTTFIGAAAPTVVASKVRIYTYLTVNGGTTWYASASVQP